MTEKKRRFSSKRGLAVFFAVLFVMMSVGTVFALDFTGDSSGGTAGGGASEGWGVPTASNALRGFRFSLVKADGTEEYGSIDVYKTSTYAGAGYNRFPTKYSKAYYVHNNQYLADGEIKPTTSTANSYYYGQLENLGATALPTEYGSTLATKLDDWQSNTNNLSVILDLIGNTDITRPAQITNDYSILIEPIYQIRNKATGTYYLMTVTEFGIWQPQSGIDQSHNAGPKSATAEFVAEIEYTGTFRITVEDMVGNKAVVDYGRVIFIDKTAPEYQLALNVNEEDIAKFTSDADGNIVSWQPWIYDESLTLNFTGMYDPNGEKASELAAIVWWKSEQKWTSATLTAEGISGAVDGEESTTETVLKADINSVTVPDQVTEDSGFTTGSITDDNNNTIATKNYTLDISKDQLPDGDYYLNFIVYDKAGNGKLVTKRIQKDSQKAVISSISIGNKLEVDENGEYTLIDGAYVANGEKIEITLGECAAESPQYVVVTTTLVTDDVSVIGDPVRVDKNTDGKFIYTITDDGKNKAVYTFVAYSGDGNQNTASEAVKLTVEEYRIDDSVPNTPVIDQSTTLGYYEDEWVQSVDTKFNVSFEATMGAPEHLEYSVVKVSAGQKIEDVAAEDVAAESFTAVYTDVTEGEYEYALTANEIGIDEEGVYVLFFRAANTVGQLSKDTVKLVVRYDDTDPTVDPEADIKFEPTYFTPQKQDNTYNRLFGTSTTIKVNGSDASTAFDGTLTYYYQVVDKDGKASEDAWTNYNTENGVTITPDSDVTVYFRVVDAAGNETFIDTGRILVNDSAPDEFQVVAHRADGSADVDKWNTDDVIFTFTSGENGELDISEVDNIDHFQYRLKDENGHWGEWIDITDDDKQAIYHYTDGDVYKAKFTAQAYNLNVQFRAVSKTGVAGETVAAFEGIKKDAIHPDPSDAITGKYSSDVDNPNWTNAPVVFTLGNTAENVAPITYKLYVTENGTLTEYTLAENDSLVWQTSPYKIEWNYTAKTLTVSGNVPKSTQFYFKAVSDAGLEGNTEPVYLSIQSTNDTLTNGNMGTVSADSEPGGTPVNGGSGWSSQWYKSGDTLPNLLYSNTYEVNYEGHNAATATQAPIYLMYTLKKQGGTEISDKTLLVSEDTSLEFCKITGDGVYTLTVWLEDAAGNKKEGEQVYTIRVDQNAPTNPSVKHGTNEWIKSTALDYTIFTNAVDANGKLTLTFGATADIAKIAKIEYAFVEADTNKGALDKTKLSTAEPTEWTEATLNGQTATAELDNNFAGRVFIRITDEAGNVVIAGTDGAVVETTAPEVKPSVPDADTNGWYKTNPVITSTPYDMPKDAENDDIPKSDIAKVVVEEFVGATVMKTTVYDTTNTDSFESCEYTVETQKEVWVRFTVTDRAGNVSTPIVVGPLKIDSANPTLGIKATYSGKAYTAGTWVNKAVTVTLSSSPISGVTYYYQVGKTDGEWTKLNGNSHTFTGDFNDTVYFKAVSGSGNEAVGSLEIKIQSSMPTSIDLFGEAEHSSNFAITPDSSDDWRNEAFEATVTAPYRNKKEYVSGETKDQAAVTTHIKIEVSTDNKTFTAVTNEVTAKVGDDALNAVNGVFSHTASENNAEVMLGFAKDYYYRVTVYATDEATNKTSVDKVYSYRLDTTAPTATVTVSDADVTSADKIEVTVSDETGWLYRMLTALQTLTFNTFFNSTATFQINADWNISERKTLQYAAIELENKAELENFIENGVAVPENDWHTITGTAFIVSNDFTGFYLIRLIDNANNEAVISTKGVSIDYYPPSIGTVTVSGSLTERDPNNGASRICTDRFSLIFSWVKDAI